MRLFKEAIMFFFMVWGFLSVQNVDLQIEQGEVFGFKRYLMLVKLLQREQFLT